MLDHHSQSKAVCVCDFSVEFFWISIVNHRVQMWTFFLYFRPGDSSEWNFNSDRPVWSYDGRRIRAVCVAGARGHCTAEAQGTDWTQVRFKCHFVNTVFTVVSPSCMLNWQLTTKPRVGPGQPSSPFTYSSFPLFTFPFLSSALPIFFFCPSLPFLPE